MSKVHKQCTFSLKSMWLLLLLAGLETVHRNFSFNYEYCVLTKPRLEFGLSGGWESGFKVTHPPFPIHELKGLRWIRRSSTFSIHDSLEYTRYQREVGLLTHGLSEFPSFYTHWWQVRTFLYLDQEEDEGLWSQTLPNESVTWSSE